MHSADLDRTPVALTDGAVNRLLRVGLDLNRALAVVEEDDAARRIRTAMARIDEAIDELRHGVLSGDGSRE